MSIAVALILAASAPSQAVEPAQAPSVRVSATAVASATIIASASVRLGEQDAAPAARDGGSEQIHRQRRASGGRVMVEFD